MAFTRTWNAAYEAQPADTENISLGAGRIRDFKSDVQERGEVDHSWAGNADDGKHKQITILAPLGSDPANIANHGFLYTKNVSAKVELFWEDEDGNVVQITVAGDLNAGFPAGTSMLFQQTLAPTGWVKQTSHNNKGMRLQTGSVTTGGANSFSTVFGAGKVTAGRALTEAQMPSHKHFAVHNSTATTNSVNSATEAMRAASAGGLGNSDYQLQSTTANPTVGKTSTTGSGTTHNHGLTMDLQFVDFIIANKS